MQKALTEKGVPSVLQGTGSVFQSNEANQLYIVLKGISEPESLKQVRAALSTDLLGMTSGELSKLNTNEEKSVCCLEGSVEQNWICSNDARVFGLEARWSTSVHPVPPSHV